MGSPAMARTLLQHPAVLGTGVSIGAAAVLIAWMVVKFARLSTRRAASARSPKVAPSDEKAKSDLQTLP